MIAQHSFTDVPLGSIDDPFTSTDAAEIKGNIYIAVQSWVPHNPHMTYGVVGSVLQGLWNAVYLASRGKTCDGGGGGRAGRGAGQGCRTTFRVVHRQYGMVGFG